MQEPFPERRAVPEIGLPRTAVVAEECARGTCLEQEPRPDPGRKGEELLEGEQKKTLVTVIHAGSSLP